MKHKTLLSAVLLASMALACMVFSGCATITDGSKQKVTLKASNDEQVVVTINDQKVTIPTTYKLPRKATEIYVYAEDNPGYQTSSVNTFSAGAQEMNPKMLLNIFGIFFFLVGNTTSDTVDLATGAAYKYANETIIIPVYKVGK